MSLRRVLLNLFICIAGFCTVSVVQSADAGLDLTLSARIVENTCQITVPEGGRVSLPIVSKSWFYNPDGSDRLQPTDPTGETVFAISIESCTGAALNVNAIHFSFQPQSQTLVAGFNNVFGNDTSPAQGGAENVGIVIFSTALNTNVLNSDGSSDVALPVENDAWATDYSFFARLQNTGPVASGKVTSNVIISAEYQ
nr:fimbrial-like protein [uncultured Enterobacter sp.]